MQLPSWLTLSRRARRNRRRLPQVPAIESLEDRTLLSLLWAYDSGIGHREFTTDDTATTIVVQVGSNGMVGVAGWGETVSAELVNTMSIATGGGDDAIDLSNVTELTFPSFSGEPDSLVITTGSGHDTIIGSGFDDTIEAGNGIDAISGGPGDDLIYGDRNDGGSGDDLIYGNDGDDRIFGGNGDDLIYGDAGEDSLLGGGGNDRIEGGTGRDLAHGGLDDDTILGEACSTLNAVTSQEPCDPSFDPSYNNTDPSLTHLMPYIKKLSFEGTSQFSVILLRSA